MVRAHPHRVYKTRSFTREQKSPTDLPTAASSAVTPNQRPTEALRQPAGVATLYSSAGYLDSSAHESARDRTDLIPHATPPCPSPVHATAARSFLDTDPRDTRYPCQTGWPLPSPAVTLGRSLTPASHPKPSVASPEDFAIPPRRGPSIRKCLRILRSWRARNGVGGERTDDRMAERERRKSELETEFRESR